MSPAFSGTLELGTDLVRLDDDPGLVGGDVEHRLCLVLGRRAIPYASIDAAIPAVIRRRRPVAGAGATRGAAQRRSAARRPARVGPAPLQKPPEGSLGRGMIS